MSMARGTTATAAAPTAAATNSARAEMMKKAREAIFKATDERPLDKGIKLGHVSTGSFALDQLIGGTLGADGKPICPGFPRRKITEIYGPESSGKTTLALSGIAAAQKAGGTAMFIDFENSLDHNYAKKLGVNYDPDQFQVYQPKTMEDGFKMILIGIISGIDIIVVDSVAAMVPAAELEKKLDESAAIGIKARVFSTQLPKFVSWLGKYPMLPGAKEDKKSDPSHPGTALLFINQTRAMIGGMGHGDNETTTGGKALKFFDYLRLRVVRIKSESIERSDPMTGKKRKFAYGNVTDVKVVKSKIDAKQGHTTSIFIRYGTGIDDQLTSIETGVYYKLIKKEGTYYAIDGQRFQGKEKLRTYFLENPAVFEALKANLLKAISAESDGAATVEEGDEFIEELAGMESGDEVSASDLAVEESIIEE